MSEFDHETPSLIPEMEASRMLERDQYAADNDVGQESGLRPPEEEPIVVDMSRISHGAPERENLSRFQRVAPGFFAQTKEPALTINGNTVTVNSTAARMFPDVEFMEILISEEERKVALKPCDELNIYGYRWAKNKDGKRYGVPRTGLPFVLCICQIMGWNPNNRYRILGKKVPDERDEEVLVFELKAGQGFEKAAPDARGKTRSTILTGWDGTFGPAYDPGEGSVRIGTFDEYTYFAINSKQAKKQPDTSPQEQGKENNAVEEVQIGAGASINQGEQIMTSHPNDGDVD